MIVELKKVENIEENILNMGPDEVADALWSEREKIDPEIYVDEELYDLGVSTLVEKLFRDEELYADAEPEEFGAVSYMISLLKLFSEKSCKEYDGVIYIKCVGVYVSFKYFGVFFFGKEMSNS